MKKLLLGLVACLFMLVNTGCSAIDSALDDYLNYCTVTIEYDYDWDGNDGREDYKDLKVVIGENEYNAVGAYKVPKGTVISLSWSYYYKYEHNYDYKYTWASASENVSIGTNGKITIRIAGPEATVMTDEFSFEFGS
ncbi:MAG: hypothetical protein J6K78_06295 [Tidjanibacter sp.]|nr:hypothetical protein [Tidjanibacter sp.]